jgi:predicted aspartyl protease
LGNNKPAVPRARPLVEADVLSNERNRTIVSQLRIAMTRKAPVLLTLFLLAACNQPLRPAVEYRPAEAGTVDHALCLLGYSAVPVREVAPGHHLIEATINGRTGSFVLDTGANVTVINASQMERFGLSPGIGGLGIGGPLRSGPATNANQAAVDSFEVGPITVRQSRVVTADLGQLLTAFGRVSGTEVSGLIGQDVLNEHRAIIDVARPMLYLMEDDRDPAPVSADRCGSSDGAEASASGMADAPSDEAS